MFTLKFYKHDEEGGLQYEVLSSPHYQVYHRRGGGITVTVFKDYTTLNGIERRVAQICYIENSAGKTIDTLRAVQEAQPT